jgi:hypothetical protein
LNPDWTVVAKAAEMKSVEIFLNFMVMDMNMNVLWKNPSGVAPAQIERMNRFWADESWRDAAYRREDDLFGHYEEKTGNEDVAEAYRQRPRMSLALNTCPDHCRCETLVAQSSTIFSSRHPMQLALEFLKTSSNATANEASANGCEFSHRVDRSDVESGDRMY